MIQGYYTALERTMFYKHIDDASLKVQYNFDLITQLVWLVIYSKQGVLWFLDSTNESFWYETNNYSEALKQKYWRPLEF